MSHVEPDTLALCALGERACSDADMAHVAECAECAAQLDAWRHVVVVATDGGPEHLEQPPPRVWAAIEQELATGGQSGPAAGGATVLTLPRRRSAGWLLAAAAGVTGLAVGATLGATVIADRTADGEPPATVVARAELEPLPDWADASGTATLVRTADGRLAVTVDVAGDEPTPGEAFREVWLIDTDVEGMVSLGVLDGESGTFVLPAGVDVADFPIVDVSLEPIDGQPTHSGNSIVRGILPA